MSLLPEFLAATMGGAFLTEAVLLVGFCFLSTIRRNLLIALAHYNQKNSS